MEWRFVAKPTTTGRISRASEVLPDLRSDLIVMTDVVDGAGNTYPDAVVPRRHAMPLPDGMFAWADERKVCDLSGTDFDLTTLWSHAYVRLVDAFDVPAVGFAHGFISEVVAAPSRPPFPVPTVGEYIVHYEPHTYWVDRRNAFVSLYNPHTSGIEDSYPARAVMT